MAKDKFETLMEIEGHTDEMEFLNECAFDSVVPAICINEGCDYTESMEPDQDKGWCEDCKTGTVQSALILKGLI